MTLLVAMLQPKVKHCIATYTEHNLEKLSILLDFFLREVSHTISLYISIRIVLHIVSVFEASMK